MSKFRLEDRYSVIKLKDIEHFSWEATRAVHRFHLGIINEARENRGAEILEGIFIESDWRCYDQVCELLRQEAQEDITYFNLTGKKAPDVSQVRKPGIMSG